MRHPGYGRPGRTTDVFDGVRGMRIRWLVLFTISVCWGGLAPPVQGIELCSPKSKQLMRSVGIAPEQIERLCVAAERASRLTRLTIRRTEDELGYCRVTLALRNDSIHHIDSFAFTSEGGRFEIFLFYDVLPGTTGYASGRSRTLMACDELPELRLALRWPGTARVDNRPLQGRRLEQFKPALQSEKLTWTR